MKIALLTTLALGLELIEPPDGKVFFATWLDTADSSPGSGDGDRPLAFNQRMGFNASCFQYAQNIPIDTYPFPYEQVYTLETDAIVYLTVYPRPSPWTVTDDQIANLTSQCSQMNRDGRRVMIRFAPEFNGNWNFWVFEIHLGNATYRVSAIVEKIIYCLESSGSQHSNGLESK
jgi:hypothetical protein